jgi:hypothetical protein
MLCPLPEIHQRQISQNGARPALGNPRGGFAQPWEEACSRGKTPVWRLYLCLARKIEQWPLAEQFRPLYAPLPRGRTPALPCPTLWPRCGVEDHCQRKQEIKHAEAEANGTDVIAGLGSTANGDIRPSTAVR